MSPGPLEDPLGVAVDAAARTRETLKLARRYLDPSLADMLTIIGFDREFTAARGSYLFDVDDHAYLDFNTGEGFASVGHNHPEIRATLEAVMAAEMADGVQIHYSPLGGMLGEALAAHLPAGLDATFFCSTGAEAVDSAMKFARAATGRTRLLSIQGDYHGVTYGPLSIVGEDFFKKGFGPFLPGCGLVPFGDLGALEKQLRKRDVAGLIMEPIQGLGVNVQTVEYLRGAAELCRRYGTLLCLDEIQTGLGRTGRWFAFEEAEIVPDFVLIAKTLSGGYMPVAAMVTTRAVYQRAVGTLERSYVHQSTYGRNRLSMAAGLATVRLIERDGLVQNAAGMGERLRSGLVELQGRHHLIGDVRGRGLMQAFELCAPPGRLAKLNWRLIHLASEGLAPQLVVIPLHRDHRIITMASGMNDVIKLLPPLNVSESEVDIFLDALDTVLTDCESGSGAGNWGVVRDIATKTLARKVGRDDSSQDNGSPEDSSGRASPGQGQVAPTPAAEVRGTPVDPDGAAICLVTGASGFVGGHVVTGLLGAGYQVRCLARSTSDTSALDPLAVEIVTADLTDPASLRQAALGCRYVVHSGALVSDWATIEEIQAANVTGTRHLLSAASAAGVERFVHISTTDVYGYPGGAQIDESHVGKGFRNWYAETKRAAEEAVREAADRDGLETVILRPATIYGPGSTETVGEIAKALKARGMMLLVGGGRADAGLCYVENLVDAILLALGADAVAGEAYNVCDGLDVTWRQFTSDLADRLSFPRPRISMPYPVAYAIGSALERGYRAARVRTGLTMRPLLSRQAVQVLGLEQSFSNRHLREQLGWEPRVGYEEAMGATVDWLREEYL
jgi:ornithine--oxo-acid transaminase